MCSRPSFNDQMPHCQRGMKPLVSNTSRIPGILSSRRKTAVRRHQRGASPWGLLPRLYPGSPGGGELAGVGGVTRDPRDGRDIRDMKRVRYPILCPWSPCCLLGPFCPLVLLGPSVRLLPRLEAADQLHGGGALGSRAPGAAPGLVLKPLLPPQDLGDLVQVVVGVAGLGSMEMLEDQADGHLPGGAVPQIPRYRIVHRSMPHLYASFQSSTAQPPPPSKGSPG